MEHVSRHDRFAAGSLLRRERGKKVSERVVDEL